MPTLTSVKSGYWSDPTTWDLGVVPADGDTVTVASGHTVIFNVDQTNFTNGLAGLTINGTLRFPSQSEDGNMPQFVHLKVNANIAGTGSLLVGSSTYPITHPQRVKISVNGTITTTTVNMYGEQRRPCWDYLAQNAPAGATQIVLTEGMPLRAGDTIAIGRSDVVTHWSSGDALTHTVTAYDPSTKTATISPALSVARNGTYPWNCLVVLLSRQIILEKYGGNNVNLMSGSGRYIQGVYGGVASGATAQGIFSLTSSILTDCSARGVMFTNGGSDVTIEYFTGTSMSFFFNNTNNINCSNSAWTNSQDSNRHYTAASQVVFVNVHLQNCPKGLIYLLGGHINNFIANNCTLKYGGTAVWGHSIATGYYGLRFSNLLLVQHGFIGSIWGGYVQVDASNITVYNANYTSHPFFYSGDIGYPSVIRDCTVNLFGGSFYFVHSRGGLPLNFRNITVQGGGTCFLGVSGTFKDINIAVTPGSPLGTFQFPGKIASLNVPTYNRPQVATTIGTGTLDRRSEFLFVEVIGLTVGGTSYPRAYEKIWNYGYLKNRWDATTPDYTTFDFYLTNTSLAKPMYLDYRVRGDNPITVTGNITQLANGDTVKVQIFRADKEPFLGDTPDYEQTYTATGAINVSWTPPSAEEWIVRVSVAMQQTTTPTTIANLEVGGGTGGGGTAGEPSFVWMG